jgi:hypothetical protein
LNAAFFGQAWTSVKRVLLVITGRRDGLPIREGNPDGVAAPYRNASRPPTVERALEHLHDERQHPAASDDPL